MQDVNGAEILSACIQDMRRVHECRSEVEGVCGDVGAEMTRLANKLFSSPSPSRGRRERHQGITIPQLILPKKVKFISPLFFPSPNTARNGRTPILRDIMKKIRQGPGLTARNLE
jgi:hypothetical protein